MGRTGLIVLRAEDGDLGLDPYEGLEIHPAAILQMGMNT
jgi:hypothetical protein